VGCIDRQLGVDPLANIGRKLAPLTGRCRREENRFNLWVMAYFAYRDKRYIANSDEREVERS